MSWTSPMPHVAKNVLSLLSKRPAIFSMGASDMSGCSTEWICFFYIHRSTFRYLTHVVRASYSDDIFSTQFWIRKYIFYSEVKHGGPTLRRVFTGLAMAVRFKLVDMCWSTRKTSKRMGKSKAHWSRTAPWHSILGTKEVYSRKRRWRVLSKEGSHFLMMLRWPPWASTSWPLFQGCWKGLLFMNMFFFSLGWVNRGVGPATLNAKSDHLAFYPISLDPPKWQLY